MWGTLHTPALCRNRDRFIPTYVGNIFLTPCLFKFFAVHPHICGEHKKYAHVRTMPIGSSPHMWGTFFQIAGFFRDIRFIPTYVGNISLVAQSSSKTTVHPHICGEHSRENSNGSNVIGSSPHMWGTYFL